MIQQEQTRLFNKNQLSKHKFRIKRRPDSVPRSWVCITPQPDHLTYAQRRDWQLVLDSRSIPYYSVKWLGSELLYVPPMSLYLAQGELQAYINENRPQKPARKFPAQKNAWRIIYFLLLLFCFYLLQKAGFPELGLKEEDLVKAGALDNIAFKIEHQWTRLITALTLHANISHLADNILFGGIFLYFLARVTGPGKAVLYTVIGGVAGNLLSVYARSYPVASMGFSTAVFASAGILAGIMVWVNKRKAILPLAAAAGILALLGTGGENTDYIAHICGLIAGLSIGIISVWASEKTPNMNLPQWMAGLCAMTIFVATWWVALNNA